MAASASGGGDDDGSIASINMTPMVDLTLVLLIIFMVAAPLLSKASSIKVNLPKAVSAETSPSSLARRWRAGRRPAAGRQRQADDRRACAVWCGAAREGSRLQAIVSADEGSTTPGRQVDVVKSLGVAKFAQHRSPAVASACRRADIVTAAVALLFTPSRDRDRAPAAARGRGGPQPSRSRFRPPRRRRRGGGARPTTPAPRAAADRARSRQPARSRSPLADTSPQAAPLPPVYGFAMESPTDVSWRSPPCAGDRHRRGRQGWGRAARAARRAWRRGELRRR
jgi:biopolymer transport protein ExbD